MIRRYVRLLVIPSTGQYPSQRLWRALVAISFLEEKEQEPVLEPTPQPHLENLNARHDSLKVKVKLMLGAMNEGYIPAYVYHRYPLIRFQQGDVQPQGIQETMYQDVNVTVIKFTKTGKGHPSIHSC